LNGYYTTIDRPPSGERSDAMRAITMTRHGGPDVLAIEELPDPVAGDGEVLIRVKAIGLNHADTYMRSGVWSFGIPVLGIEAAGVVEQDPSGELAPGTTVVAVVGGMARDRNGSYADWWLSQRRMSFRSGRP